MKGDIPVSSTYIPSSKTVNFGCIECVMEQEKDICHNFYPYILSSKVYHGSGNVTFFPYVI